MPHTSTVCDRSGGACNIRRASSLRYRVYHLMSRMTCAAIHTEDKELINPFVANARKVNISYTAESPTTRRSCVYQFVKTWQYMMYMMYE